MSRELDKHELFIEENRKVMERADCVLCGKRRFVKRMRDGVCMSCLDDPDVPTEDGS